MAGYHKRHGLHTQSQLIIQEETKANNSPSGSSDSGFVDDEPCTPGGKQKIYSGTRKNGR